MTLNLLRGPTAGHFDVARILWALGAVCAIGFTGAHLVMNHTFSIIDFGIGYGGLLAGGGGATALKDTAVAKAAAAAGKPE